MPYSKEHKQQSRDKILDSAGRLFSHQGFEAISIDELMKDAGLTRGAFYNHFANKEEVYAEAITYRALHSPFTHEKLEAGSEAEWFEKTIGAYLSREHIDDSPAPCPLAFLVTDIGKREGIIRSTYTRVYKNLNKLFRRRLKERPVSQETISAVTAMMIGGVAIARALDDKRAADKLLLSCREQARALLKIR